jgi:hypothetical protein
MPVTERTLCLDKEEEIERPVVELAIRRGPGWSKYGGRRFTFALLRCFVHYLSSGDPAPSQEDQEITRRLKETGDILAIRVLDHVILGDERIFSFRD